MKWPAVDTSKPAAKITIKGDFEGITTLKAQLDVTVNPLAAALDSVSSTNLGEVVLKFNSVMNAQQLAAIANYTIKVGTATKTIVAATPSADNTSVTLTVSEDSAFAQNDKVDVTVGGTLLPTASTKSVNVTDLALPFIAKVSAVGNKQIQVTFSEPMKKATALQILNYKIDGNQIFGLFDGNDLSADRKTVIINLPNRLTAGSHNVNVTNVQDYAGYPVRYEQSLPTVTVTDDPTLPAIASVVSVSQTSLVVLFNKEIETPLVSNITATMGQVIGTSVSGKQLTVTFSFALPLPVTQVTVTFNNITDLYGHVSGLISQNVTAVPDLVKPAVLSVTSDVQNQIVVQYSKKVLISGGWVAVNPCAEYAVKDQNGNAVPVSAAFGADHTSVILTPGSGGNYAPGTYSVYISGVVDDNPLKNTVLPAMYAVVIPDKTPPAVITTPAQNSGVMIDGTNDRLYIKFTEPVTSNTACLAANYMFVVSGDSIKTVPASTNILLMSDNKTVCLTFQSADMLVASIKTVQVSNIADQSGNVMMSQPVQAPFSVIGAAPAMTAARVTGLNSIQVVLSSSVMDSTKSPADFYITNNNPAGAEPVYITGISYDDGVKTPGLYTITLTTQQTLSTDGKYNNFSLKINTIPSPNACNAYGQRLVGGTMLNPLADAYAPAASIGSAKYMGGTGTVIDVNVSERLAYAVGNITVTADKSQFIVTLNGSARTFTVSHILGVYPGFPSTLRFTIPDTGAATGSTARILFFSVPPPATMVDAAQNPMTNFDLSAVVQ